MATRGPASVLDRRDPDTSVNIVRDRLTRHRSPARDYKRYSYGSDISADEAIDLPVQSYRTSFSAVVSPNRTKHDRSRSTSPCTSSLKGSHRSRSKSPGGRRAHKHVTYNDQVVIRDSGTSNSIITNLSDKDYTDSSCGDSAFASDMSSSSPRDYSSELRELSQQIVREYSTSEESAGDPRMSSHNKKHVNGSKPNGSIADSRSPQPPSHPTKQVVQKNNKMIVSEDYDNDRSVSYRVAIQNHYSEDIKQEAAKIMESAKSQDDTPTSGHRKKRGDERPSRRKQEETQDERPSRSLSERKPPRPADEVDYDRRTSLPQDPAVAKSRLTPAKRSISSSIGNFFRRLSPHMGRRNKKGNLGKASSQSLSHGDDLDGSFDKHASTSSLHRGKLRRSLMKMFGKSRKSNRSLNKSDLSVEDLNQSNNSAEETGRPDQQRSPPYMKSIEQNSKEDKDVYYKFITKQKKTRESTAPGKRQPMKASPGVISPDRVLDKESNGDIDQVDKLEPPNSLDVRLVPKSVKSLQASKMSSISVDDSIGDCSIDPNLTGSEPSLVSQTSASKHVALSQASHDGTSPNHPSPTHHIQPVREETLAASPGYTGTETTPRKSLDYAQMPQSAEYYPKDISRTPSYLRISSAVSGYGHYSKYSAYQGIAKRSPYSSTLSLRSSRSDLATPISPSEMPIGKILNIQAPTNYPPVKTEPFSPKSLEPVSPKFDETDSSFNTVTNGASESKGLVDNEASVNGQAGVENGQNGHSTNVMVNSFVSSGDTIKDGDYFLDVAQIEESRLLLLCSKCELELQDETVTEEACGKIRSAVGKANLLINQKFRQFQELCEKHKNPDPGAKLTKCEDLQGFWEMVKIQVDDVDEMFTEVDLMKQNGWREIKPHSRRSSSSSRSSPKSGTGSLSVSNTSTPSHTPGSRRKAARLKDTPESSPERSQKAKQNAKAREEARKKMLAEKRAAMKQQKIQVAEDVEIYVADNSSKSNSPSRTNGSSEEV